MLLNELFEGINNYLYHVMLYEKAIDVFENDAMKANWWHKIDNREVFGNSFTRNPRLYWLRPVRLFIDKNKIRNNKIIPLDAEYVFANSHDITSQMNRRERIYYSEWEGSDPLFKEEFVVGDIKNIHRIIETVELVANTNVYRSKMSGFQIVDLYEQATEYCEKWKIKLIIDPKYQEEVDKTLKLWSEEE